MKLGMSILLGASLLMLAAVLIRNRMSWGWLKRFAIHIAAAAFVIYLINYSGWAGGAYIPINPATLAAVVLLGVPGIALIVGLQWTLF